MRLRGINEDMIEGVLLQPEWSPATTRGTRYDGFVDGRHLAVVVDESGDPVVVVTVFWADEETTDGY